MEVLVSHREASVEQKTTVNLGGLYTHLLSIRQTIPNMPNVHLIFW